MCKIYSKLLNSYPSLPQPDLTCYICMEEVNEDSMRTLCANDHIACYKCAKKSFQKSRNCPFCRENCTTQALYFPTTQLTACLFESFMLMRTIDEMQRNSKWKDNKKFKIESLKLQLGAIKTIQRLGASPANVMNDTGDWQQWLADSIEFDDDYEYSQWEPNWKKHTLKYTMNIIETLVYQLEHCQDTITDTTNLHTVYGLEC